MQSTPSLPSLPGPVWLEVVAPDRVLFMGKKKVGNRCRGRPEGSLFISNYTVGEGATPFPGLLHFTFDMYLVSLSVKQGVSSTISLIYGMMRPGIEPRSPGPLVNIQPTRPMSQLWSNRTKLCIYAKLNCLKSNCFVC